MRSWVTYYRRKIFISLPKLFTELMKIGIERFSKWFSDETGRSLDEYDRDLLGGTAVVLGHLSYAYIKTSTRLA